MSDVVAEVLLEVLVEFQHLHQPSDMQALEVAVGERADVAAGLDHYVVAVLQMPLDVTADQVSLTCGRSQDRSKQDMTIIPASSDPFCPLSWHAVLKLLDEIRWETQKVRSCLDARSVTGASFYEKYWLAQLLHLTLTLHSCLLFLFSGLGNFTQSSAAPYS